MSTATLFGPTRHPRGVAFTVEARTDRDDWGPLQVKWRGFGQDTVNDEAWTFEWQSRADRLTACVQSVTEKFKPVTEALKDSELCEFVNDVCERYRERLDLDEDAPDDEVKTHILRDIAQGRFDLYDDMWLAADHWSSIGRAALECLPLPRWARIETDVKGRTLLVLRDRRSMDDFEYFLEHGRSRRRARRQPRPAGRTQSPRRARPNGPHKTTTKRGTK